MKFKKHISIFLAFFILVSNMGLAFNVHFCEDTIASISLKSTFSNDNSKNDECCDGIQEESNCCKDKVFQFQKKSEYAVLKSISSELHFDFIVPQCRQSVIFESVQNFETATIPVYYCDAHAPPLFKLFNQYIFYDKF